MTEKSSSASPRSPKSRDSLNAPLTTIDLDKTITQIKVEPAWKKAHHNSLTLFKSRAMRVVLIGMHQDALIKTHATKAVISVQVLQGKIDFETDQKGTVLQTGEMLTLHKKIPHRIKACEESFFLLTLAFENPSS